MPSSRAAWPRLAGRWRSSFWRTSVEGPGARRSRSRREWRALLLAEGRDVELLALDIDGVARVDLELRGDVRIEAADLGPDRASRATVDIGISQQLEGGPPAAVAIDVEAVLGGFVGREGQAAQQRRALVKRSDFAAKAALRSRADAADVEAERRQALVGIVGAKRQPVLGARGEHAVGLGDAARDQVVDHHAEIAVGAGDDEAARARPPPRAPH